MNYNNRIITALAPLKIHVFPDFYDANQKLLDEEGKELPKLNEWITFNYVSENPLLFGDDEDIEEKTEIDVHFYTKNQKKVLKVKELIKKALRSEGFLIESVIPCQYEADTGFFHLTVSISDTQ